MNEQNGRWITINGRRIFIKDKNSDYKKEVADKVFGKKQKEYVKDEGSYKFTGSEATGGGVNVYAGSVGDYDFIADSEGGIEYFDKKHKMTIEKYLNLEDDAWNGKYGSDIGGAYDFEQKYAKYNVIDPKIEAKILEEVNNRVVINDNYKKQMLKDYLRQSGTKQEDLYYKTGYHFEDVKNMKDFEEVKRLIDKGY